MRDKLADQMLSQLETVAAYVAQHGLGCEEHDLKAVGKAAGALLLDAEGWEFRSAFWRESDRGRGVIENLMLAFYTHGLWPQIINPAEPDGAIKTFAWQNAVEGALSANQLRVARYLLQAPGSTQVFLARTQAKATGTSVPWPSVSSSAFPTGYPSDGGWCWLARNLPADALGLLIEQGADPNYIDGAGRPVLAYAHKPETIALLLEKGADPLGAQYDFDIRARHLRALWTGWMGEVSKDEVADHRGLAYLRARVAGWPLDERVRAIEPLLGEMVVRLLGKNAWEGTRRAIGVLNALVEQPVDQLPSIWHMDKYWVLHHYTAFMELTGGTPDLAGNARARAAGTEDYIEGIPNGLWACLGAWGKGEELSGSTGLLAQWPSTLTPTARGKAIAHVFEVIFSQPTFSWTGFHALMRVLNPVHEFTRVEREAVCHGVEDNNLLAGQEVRIIGVALEHAWTLDAGKDARSSPQALSDRLTGAQAHPAPALARLAVLALALPISKNQGADRRQALQGLIETAGQIEMKAGEDIAFGHAMASLAQINPEVFSLVERLRLHVETPQTPTRRTTRL